jgi:hypothetical protein
MLSPQLSRLRDKVSEQQQRSVLKSCAEKRSISLISHLTKDPPPESDVETCVVVVVVFVVFVVAAQLALICVWLYNAICVLVLGFVAVM